MTLQELSIDPRWSYRWHWQKTNRSSFFTFHIHNTIICPFCIQIANQSNKTFSVPPSQGANRKKCVINPHTTQKINLHFSVICTKSTYFQLHPPPKMFASTTFHIHEEQLSDQKNMSIWCKRQICLHRSSCGSQKTKVYHPKDSDVIVNIFQVGFT